MSLQLINYKCPVCGAYENDVWADEDAPVCCETMKRCLSKGGQTTFRLFRSYTAGGTVVDSKDAERRLLAKCRRPGESLSDIRITRDDPHKAKMHLDELKHKAVKINKHNDKIVKKIHNMKEPNWVK